MAKSRTRKKKKQVQPLPRKDKQGAAIPKSTTRQKVLVGIMLLAMALFVGGGLLKSFMGTGNKGMKTGQIVEPQFRIDGAVNFIKAGSEENAVKIEVEKVQTLPAIAQGLMHRKSMGENQGMLFTMPQEEPQSFWMKNTHIPLDIIFVNANREIVTIHRETTPMSEAPLDSGKPSKYVVEVNAGFCERHSINVGDSIQF